MSGLPEGFVIRGDSQSELPDGFILRGKQLNTQQSSFDGALSDIGRNSLESFKNTATATGEAMSEPLVGENTPVAMIPMDYAVRSVGKLGNALGGIYGTVASPVTGALTASVENSGVIPAAAAFIKRNLVPNDPRFNADLSQEQQHGIAQQAGSDLTNATFMGASGIQGRNLRNTQDGIPTPKPYNPITETISPALSKLEVKTQNLPGILGDTSSAAPIDLTPSIKQVADKSAEYYNFADQGNAFLKPNAVNNIINSTVKNVSYQTPEGIAFAGENIVTKTLGDLQTLKDKPLSLRGADEVDGIIQDRISSAFRSGDNQAGSKLIEIRDSLRNARTGATRDSMVNPEAFDAWRTGDELFSAKSKMQEMQSVIDNAYMTDNPVTAMRTGFKNLAKQVNKNPKGYTPEEVASINKAAKTGIVTGALKVMGSRLIAGVAGGVGGAAGGGIPGAIGGVAAGEAVAYPMRAAANKLQENRANAPIRMVAKRPGVTNALNNSPVNGPQPKSPLRLSYQPEEKTVVVNSYGQAVPMTKSSRDILGSQAPSFNRKLLAASDTDKAAFSDSWDKLDAEQQALISKQIERAWARDNKTPLSSMIIQAKQAMDDLVAAKGSDVNNPAMRDALLGAVREPTMKEIMAMKPADARKALGNYQRRKN